VGRDGTLWEWGQSGSRVGKPASFGVEPTQVDTNCDWMSVAATTTYTVALRTNGTLWAWGDNSIGQLGTGPGPSQIRPVQVGTNSDWAAICCPWSGTMALRRDGTLWAWGPVYVVGSWGDRKQLAVAHPSVPRVELDGLRHLGFPAVRAEPLGRGLGAIPCGSKPRGFRPIEFPVHRIQRGPRALRGRMVWRDKGLRGAI